ncbi:hypothetical protein ACFRR7_17570 [Streptomyces sp. NPDC056909]|uniref:hypothetical protein n=1 Tax=Streptomyces sp. NPDC056909 TaxID=3345963 RepID=UPI00368CC4A3
MRGPTGVTYGYTNEHHGVPVLVLAVFTATGTTPAQPVAVTPDSAVSSTDRLRYYNASTDAAAVGTLDANNNHITLRVYLNGSFATGWSRVAPV